MSRKPRYKTYTQGDYTDTLYQALLAQSYEAVESLLDGGVSPNVLRGNLPPLHLAIAQEDERMVALLLSFGADVNAQCTVLQLSPLMLAVAQNDIRMCKRLLDGGADTDARGENGLTALMLAVTESNADITRLLITAGADMFQRNSRDQIAYDIALQRGSSECAAVLYATMCLPRLHRARTLNAPRLPWRKK